MSQDEYRRNQLSDPGTRTLEELLRGLDVIRDGQLLNAAVALFVRPERVLPIYSQCVIRQALREVLINAFSHRDYQAGGGAVTIAIFDDRLEIASTGGLHFGLTPDALRRPHPSRPWNPLIASVLYRRGMIEQWGRGTLKIGELAEQAGIAQPEFEERVGDLVVRFRPSSYVAPRRVERALNSLQRELLHIIGSATNGAALSQILEQLESPTPERTIQDTLRSLRDLGLVQSIGWARGARWRLSEP